MTSSRCKTCDAEIIWIVTPSGKSMPVDAKAETLWLLEPDGGQGGSARARPVQVRKSHFSTCPQADEHRRPR